MRTSDPSARRLLPALVVHGAALAVGTAGILAAATGIAHPPPSASTDHPREGEAAAPPASVPPPSSEAGAAKTRAARSDRTSPPAASDPGVRARIIARSASGLWLFRIDNEGSTVVRVPADIRLLRVSVEDGDTTSKTRARPVKCKTGELAPTAFPDRSALLLGPGESYLEAFDPRLFCFGHDSEALVGGAVVRAQFGWPAQGQATKHPVPPFVVEDTKYPPTEEPMKVLTVPTILLSHLPPDNGATSDTPMQREPRPLPAPVLPPPVAEPKPVASGPLLDGFGRQIPAPGASAGAPSAPLLAPAAPGVASAAPAPNPVSLLPPPSTVPPEPGGTPSVPALPESEGSAATPESPKPSPVVDENAAHLEVTTTPFVDMVDGRKATVTITLKNSGRRSTLVALRPRMVMFRIDGPDGLERCGDTRRAAPLERRSFPSLRPGGEVAMPVIVGEACGIPLFHRPGLYKLTVTVTLSESGAAQGIVAYTGTLVSETPTLLRVQSGDEPFYRSSPSAVNTRLDDSPP